MSGQWASGDELSDEQKELSKSGAPKDSYMLTVEDERELEVVLQERAALEERIDKLDRNAHLDGLREHFPLGTGGNRRSGDWQNRKRFDASFDKAKKLAPLYENHLRLLAQEHAILTGKRAKEREYEGRRQRERQKAAEGVLNAHIGDYVHDSAYGTVRVIRVNKLSLTIETETGRRESRKFSFIERVVFTEEEIIDWFVKRDASGRFPIHAYIREALAGNIPIGEVASWLKDETYNRYPLFIRNLPWQKIAQHFYEEGNEQKTSNWGSADCQAVSVHKEEKED